MTQQKKSIKQHISNHIQRHHKKYIFASGLTLGRGIVKIILVIGGIVGISIFANKGNSNTTAESQVKMYQALDTFNQFEDIAHIYDEIIHELGYDQERTGNHAYHEAEKAFHEAENLNEKFRAARKFNESIHQQHEFLIRKGQITQKDHNRFYEIETIFHKIQ